MGPSRDGDHYVVDDEHHDERGDQREEAVPPKGCEDYSEEDVEEGPHVAQQAFGEIPVRGIVVDGHGRLCLLFCGYYVVDAYRIIGSILGARLSTPASPPPRPR